MPSNNVQKERAKKYTIPCIIEDIIDLNPSKRADTTGKNVRVIFFLINNTMHLRHTRTEEGEWDKGIHSHANIKTAYGSWCHGVFVSLVSKPVANENII